MSDIKGKSSWLSIEKKNKILNMNLKRNKNIFMILLATGMWITQ